MTDTTLVDSFNEAVGLVYQQDRVPFYAAAVEDVAANFVTNFRKAEETDDAEAMDELVTGLTLFIVGQANTVPSSANYCLAIGTTVETLCQTLTETVKDRSLIPQDFMLLMLEGAQKINNQPGGKHYETAKHATVGKIMTTAQQFKPATLVRPPSMEVYVPKPLTDNPRPVSEPTKVNGKDFTSLLRKI